MKNLTICINTACNELDNLKLLFKSLEQNLSTLTHEILVFIDSDNENTFEWLMTQKQVFSNLKILKNHLPIPYGYQRNINEMFLQATNGIVSYLQSDMVICKDYDLEVLKHVEPNMILCSTRIEPPLHPSSGEKYTADFGLDPNTFDLETFTNHAQTLKKNTKTSYFFAPFTLYKQTWNSIGGHDTQFRRSREDSDILTRLVLNDTQIVQTWEALVYHFTCTSSRGKNWFDKNNINAQLRAQLQQQADSIEMSRFIRKWGKFNHSANKIKYYNISAKITGTSSLDIFNSVQMYFNKISAPTAGLVIPFLDNLSKQHDTANELLNVSEEDWDKYGYMFRQELPQFVDKVEDDIIVEFDISKINHNNFSSFLINLQDIISTSIDEEGDYEYDIFKITVNKLEDVSASKIKVVNPSIKEQDLYHIY
jgi:hypothetical protein